MIFVSGIGWVATRIVRRADRNDTRASCALAWLVFRRNEIERARMRRIAKDVGLPTLAYEPTTWPAPTG